MAGDSQWRAQVAANLHAASENMRRQNEINAYNARTQAIQQPVNVHHSGYIDHRVRANVYHY